MNHAKLVKLKEFLGNDTAADLEALSSEELKSRIVQAHQAIGQAKEELEANPKYQEIKEQAKALSGGYRDVKKRQQAISDYALSLLAEKGN